MLRIINIEEQNKWDEAVQSIENYDVYYLSGYVKAFQLHGDGTPMLFYVEDENTKGVNVVMKRDIAQDPRVIAVIPDNTYFDFATPYGYGGWIFNNDSNEDSIRKLLAEYKAWCAENSVVCEFVRFHPVLGNQKKIEKEYNIIPLGHTIAMTLESEDQIWANLSSKNRNVVRKAIKNGIEIHHGNSDELYQTFRTIYNKTMDKDNADPYYFFSEDFYKSINHDLKDNSEIFYATLNGEIIATSIMIFANGYMNYHLSGSLREYQHLAPSNLLLVEAAKWGFENGMKTLHLGGGVGSKEDSLYKFKEAFYRGEPYQYYIGNCLFNKEQYDKLISLRTDLAGEVSFFPKYRA